MNRDFEEQVKPYYRGWTDGLLPGGQALIRQKPRDDLSRAVSATPTPENRLPITEESIFHIASISQAVYGAGHSAA